MLTKIKVGSSKAADNERKQLNKEQEDTGEEARVGRDTAPRAPLGETGAPADELRGTGQNLGQQNRKHGNEEGEGEQPE